MLDSQFVASLTQLSSYVVTMVAWRPYVCFIEWRELRPVDQTTLGTRTPHTLSYSVFLNHTAAVRCNLL